MASNDNSGYYFGGDNKWYQSPAKIIPLSVLILMVLVIYFYAWRAHRRHAREVAQLPINGVSTSQPINRGLYPSVIASLPTFLYNPAYYQNLNNECAVCLSNLEEGEMARVIPTCKHMFHLQCINMWLSSHSTCPICRSPVHATSTADQHQEMSLWVPSKGPQLDSFFPATQSLEGTSECAFSQNLDKSNKMIQSQDFKGGHSS
ncbi:hypothetical protein NE237_000591 [Protea cynaroides]|uniref:RING-type E3 ubiquitin transferase n=1 Tax=Protea cynaroides TaxID=273540 RepID=A0A9Q0KRS9_9MAGN|nr:hypothetical protein NE237_000591 [Protea cynaroides]